MTPDPPLPPDRPVAAPGDRSAAVGQITGWLAQLALLPAGRVGDLYDADVVRAVRAFQQARGLSPDGVVGQETYHALEGARWELGARVLRHQISHPYTGDDVVALQLRLAELGFDIGRCDGLFADRTEAALRDFQRNYGLTADGTVGPATVRALQQIRRSVKVGSSHELREAEALRRRGPALAGKRVIVDAGHGGDDPGHTGHGLVERDVTADLAARVEGRLAAAGAAAYLTHGQDQSPSDLERAQFANETDADLLVSLHCDGAPSATPHGVAAYYYGTGPESGSAPGERLAGLLQREVAARTGLFDARTHPVTWQLLRRTRMAAVHLDLGYVTHPGDAALLAREDVRDTIAEAVVVAVQRMFLPDEQDPPTGALDLSSIAELQRGR
ncbi:MAG TPA: N-acetylmuramoyl-L-alanine amidase [Mycobacteriales bacterium]